MVIIGGRLSSWVSDLTDQSNQLPEKGSTSQPIGEHAYCEDCDDDYADYDDHLMMMITMKMITIK